MYPQAYFITWSCYGARLHGDARGTVDRWHNQYGAPLLPQSDSRMEWDKDRMAEGPLVVSERGREVVRDTIKVHADIRGWHIRALNVRTNHVHVVVSAALDPESVMGQFKAWCSRRLREAGLIEGREKVWTPHGSTRYIWEDEGLYEAVKYVLDLQG